MSELRDAILRHVNDQRYRPVKPKVIAKKLGLEESDVSRVKKEIKRLVREKELAYGPSHLVCPSDGTHPAAKVGQQPAKNKRPNHITGIFRRNTSGYGFVRPEGTQKSAGRDADIFIPAKSAGDAASGDTVRVKLDGKLGHKGKPEGQIMDIVERANNRFVGTYYEDVGMAMVSVDGGVFNQPINVGDPGASGVRPDDKVVMEMVRFPSNLREGEGVIVDILGQRGQPGVDTLSVIHEFGLPGEFPEEALEYAREQAVAFDESIPEGRKDFTGETVITIDPVTARDFDDAISLRRLENGHWLLGVHIADVSHFVQPKTPLDQEARDRATSVYLPDRVIPMLPEVISNNLASLQPDRVRYSVTAEIEFNEEGVRIGTDVSKGAIKSCRRFTYEEVDEYLADRASWKSKLTPEVHRLVGDMHTLAMTLRKRRFKRGSLELHMPELKIDLDADGKVSGAHLAENTESHQMIEEFMLAANEAVAERLSDEGLIFLRRVHGAPDPRRLKALTEFASSLGLETDNLQNRFALQKLLDEVKGDPRQHAVNFATLRSMQRAIYSPEDDGHFALASDCYCHFTSPIRRYPDLTIHRLIEALTQGRKPVQDYATMLALGDHCSEREQRATSAERELTKVKLLDYFSDKVGKKMHGVVTGVESFGVFITAKEIPAEGLAHISSLTDDHYKYDRAGHILTGFRSGNTYRLGDTVEIEVAAVDLDKRELDFRIIQQKKRGKGGTKSRGPKSGGSKSGTEFKRKSGGKGGKGKGKNKGKGKKR